MFMFWDVYDWTVIVLVSCATRRDRCKDLTRSAKGSSMLGAHSVGPCAEAGKGSQLIGCARTIKARKPPHLWVVRHTAAWGSPLKEQTATFTSAVPVKSKEIFTVAVSWFSCVLVPVWIVFIHCSSSTSYMGEDQNGDVETLPCGQDFVLQ